VAALLNHAKGRPVIQECRTASRVGALKRRFGGTHIYAWRNPRDQWWSFKINDYFDTGMQLILNANPHPQVIDRVRAEIGFQEFHDDDIAQEFSFFATQKAHADHSYLAFYVLWALAWKDGSANADVCINVDQLGRSGRYRESAIDDLAKQGVQGLDFSDCRIHSGFYSAGENDWFSRIEERAVGLLMASGWSRADIDDLAAGTNIRSRSVQSSGTASELKEDLRRSRQVALRLHDRLSDMAIFHRRDLIDKEVEHASALNTLSEASRRNTERAEVAALREAAATAAEQGRRHMEEMHALQGKYVEDINQGRRHMEDVLRTFFQREQELGTQLASVQRQAAAAAAEQARNHMEEMHTLQETFSQREQDFGARLLAVQQLAAEAAAEQGRRQQEQIRALEDEHAKDIDRARRELEDLLRTMARRERELATQLLAVQQQAAGEAAEKVRLFTEHESKLRRQLDDVREELRLVGQGHVQREREITELLLTIRRKADDEINMQAARHREQAQELQREQNERIGQLHEQLRSERAVGEHSLNALRTDLAALRNSLSWRFTTPLRAAGRWFVGAPRAQSSTPTQENVVAYPHHPANAHAPQLESYPPGATSMSADATKTVSPSPMDAADNLKALLQYQDRQFVECAYLTLLKREPDPQGLSFYLERLRGGEAKLQILSELYSSAEAREAGADLPWLHGAMRRQRLTRLPVVGVVLKSFINRESKSELASRLRVLEQKVFLLEQLAEDPENFRRGQRAPGSLFRSDAHDAAPDLSGMPMAAKRIFRELSDRSPR
jgi:hypothetical protein